MGALIVLFTQVMIGIFGLKKERNIVGKVTSPAENMSRNEILIDGSNDSLNSLNINIDNDNKTIGIQLDNVIHTLDIDELLDSDDAKFDRLMRSIYNTKGTVKNNTSARIQIKVDDEDSKDYSSFKSDGLRRDFRLQKKFSLQQMTLFMDQQHGFMIIPKQARTNLSQAKN